MEQSVFNRMMLFYIQTGQVMDPSQFAKEFSELESKTVLNGIYLFDQFLDIAREAKAS
jgi:polyphosphate kinase 2 (PPK2 family)